jgi:hypothetical protein
MGAGIGDTYVRNIHLQFWLFLALMIIGACHALLGVAGSNCLTLLGRPRDLR